jgi:hypothetical protein
MRFDDLDAVVPPPPPWYAPLSEAWRATAPARRKLEAALRDGTRRGAPAAARVWRRSVVLSALVLLQVILLTETVLRRSAPALSALRIGARNHRLIAAGAAALIAVMGLSAGVVASRGTGRAAPAIAGPAGGAARAPIVDEAPLPASPVAVSAAVVEVTEAPDTIAPDPAPPVRPKRKHVKRPARQDVRVKPAKPATSR